MKKNLLLVLFTFSFLSLQAQVFEANPNPLQGTYEADLSYQYANIDAHVNVVNVSSDTVHLKWTLEVIDAPEDWALSICDLNSCYTAGVISNINPDGGGPNTPVDLAPGDTSLMDLRVWPYLMADSAKAKIHLSLVSDPDSILLTIDYDVKIIDIISSSFFVSKPKLKVFPNPTTEFFQIQNDQSLDEIVVYNLLGRQVRSFIAMEGSQYSLHGLADGIYMIGLINHQKGVVKTLRLYKRSLRP